MAEEPRRGVNSAGAHARMAAHLGADLPVARIAPPAILQQPAPAAVLAALPGARAVGGAVRDALAGLAVHDVDIASPFPPEENIRRLRAAGLKVAETGLDHGTVTAVLQGQPVEVTSLRRDLVTDGRHAEVAWTQDWREDAARRDFTINAMSLTAEGALFDYFGGQQDLAAGRLRFVGDATTRLAEDYLRALRFFRFWARYARHAPDAPTLQALREAVPGLARLSAERVWSEIKRVLEGPHPVAALELMLGCGVLQAVLPEATELPVLRRLVQAGAPPEALLRLAALLPLEAPGLTGGVTRGPAPGVPGIATRLRLANAEAKSLKRLLEDTPPAAGASTGQLRQWRGRCGLNAEEATAGLWLAEARDGVVRSTERALVAGQAVPEFPLLGRDVMALGIPPGPRIGTVLEQLRQRWLLAECAGDRAHWLEELQRVAGTAAPG